MKEEYIAPEVEIVQFASEVTLSAISGGDKNIGYGGIDTSGGLEPSSKIDSFDESYNDEELENLW